MKRTTLILCLLVVACSNPGGTILTGDSGLEDRGTSSGDVQLTPDQTAPPETADAVPAADVEDGWLFEVTPDLPGPQCEAGEGCFLDQCESNDDCLSGWCVQHLGQGVCTQTCQDECPPGWTCNQADTGGADLVFVCVSGFANLCRPCVASGDCVSTGGAEDACLDYGPDGNFCGGPCALDDDCPWGFSCLTTITVDGVSTLQCVADAGECPCTDSSVALGLATQCSVENEFGICTGQRACLEEGLTDCDAPAAAPELCNGLDDDCDGDSDEPNLVDGNFVNLCDDGNQCTEDKCTGEEGCVNTVLDTGDCTDGNACTVADHCEAGTCVGEPVICDDQNPCTENVCTENGGCEFPPMGGDCDDGDPCTLGDHCSAGICGGEAVACDCQVDGDCAALEDGDICNGTLVCDTASLPYICRVADGTGVDCPAPKGINAPCLASACDPDTGICSYVPANDDVACNDGDNCTFGEVCQAGECGGGQNVNCNDGNVCTNDACDSALGCLNSPNIEFCSDGNICTVKDQCDDGLCIGGDPLACSDDNPCTDDSCSPAVGCTFLPNAGDCDDGDLCTVDDHCDGGQCIATMAGSCDDDNVCTNDSCDPAQGCIHLLNQVPCDDGDVCTQGDHCKLGECIGTVELVCNDGNLCTNDSCDSEIGCSFVPNAADCDDGNACTVNDGCSKGWCAGGGQLDCDDENPCTNDACDFVDGCIHFDNAMACEDGNACTTGDLCAASLCVGGEPLNCDDDNVCTDDSCNPAIGCLNVANAAPCNDGNSCTTEDTCAKSSCQGGPAPDCNDDNACSEDTCDPDSGCVNTPLTGTECTDFTVCTDGDECVAGACIPGPALVCDDDDYCTNDSCDPIDGCASEVFAPCCGNGDLEAGEECDDGNQDDGDGCNGNCQMDGKLVPGNTTKIVSRQGFKIQCKEWSGDTCNRMWFSVPDPAITIKANCGVDDTTTLRPVWHGQTDEQCKTMCWIATGDSTCLASASGSGSGSHSGWMYGVGYNIGCDNDGRQYSQVTVPTVGNQVWSFDKFSWQRDGSFSSYRCNW
jgi:cysteine-rich repeat protein